MNLARVSLCIAFSCSISFISSADARNSCSDISTSSKFGLLSASIFLHYCLDNKPVTSALFSVIVFHFPL